MTESRPVRILLRIGSIGVLGFLYLPIVVLAIYAFNDSRIQTWPPISFTLKWFGDAVANLDRAIQDHAAQVSCDSMPTVSGDAVQLTQLFQNLIGNAIKFRGTARPEIHVTAERRDGAIEFAVRDNGIGFDPKYAPKVFVIFQRLHARGKYPGTGIGLAVCKRIVENHGGRIWVDSTPGKGTTFFFTIADEPLAAPNPTYEGGISP